MRPMPPYASSSLLALLVTLASLTGGCTKYIPNTTVPDTADNRQVLEFMEQYRNAVEDEDLIALMDMASPEYLDLSGTPSGSDDIDYDSLRELLQELFARVEDVRFEIKYRHVVYREQDVLVEFKYTASWLIRDASGETSWRHKVEDKRMVLVYDEEAERYRIISGM